MPWTAVSFGRPDLLAVSVWLFEAPCMATQPESRLDVVGILFPSLCAGNLKEPVSLDESLFPFVPHLPSSRVSVCLFMRVSACVRYRLSACCVHASAPDGMAVRRQPSRHIRIMHLPSLYRSVCPFVAPCQDIMCGSLWHGVRCCLTPLTGHQLIVLCHGTMLMWVADRGSTCDYVGTLMGGRLVEVYVAVKQAALCLMVCILVDVR